MRESAVGSGQIGKMFAERFELGEREVQLGIFVSETIEILRGLLKVFHRCSRLGCDRLDHFQHLRRGITQVGSAFASANLAVFSAAGGFGSLGKICINRVLASR